MEELKLKYVSPSAQELSASLSLEDQARFHLQNFVELDFVDGLFTRLIAREGFPETLKMSLNNPQLFDEYLRQELAVLRDELRARAGQKPDALIVIADDIAFEDAAFIDEGALHILFDVYAELTAFADLPLYVFHSDGKLSSHLPYIKNSGFHAVHLATHEARTFKDMLKVARRIELSVLGGFKTSFFIDVFYGEWLISELKSNPYLFLSDDAGMLERYELKAYLDFAEDL